MVILKKAMISEIRAEWATLTEQGYDVVGSFPQEANIVVVLAYVSHPTSEVENSPALEVLVVPSELAAQGALAFLFVLA